MASTVLWTDKKRPFFGLPISFTRYTLTEDRLLIDSGILVKHQEEVRLYRMADFAVTQSFLQRIFYVGDVNISSSDNMQGDFTLKSIRKPYTVKDMLSDAVEKERGEKGTSMKEHLRQILSEESKENDYGEYENNLDG